MLSEFDIWSQLRLTCTQCLFHLLQPRKGEVQFKKVCPAPVRVQPVHEGIHTDQRVAIHGPQGPVEGRCVRVESTGGPTPGRPGIQVAREGAPKCAKRKSADFGGPALKRRRGADCESECRSTARSACRPKSCAARSRSRSGRAPTASRSRSGRAQPLPGPEVAVLQPPPGPEAAVPQPPPDAVLQPLPAVDRQSQKPLPVKNVRPRPSPRKHRRRGSVASAGAINNTALTRPNQRYRMTITYNYITLSNGA